jgi:predicted RNase H-like HicB family nuclease
MHKIQVIIEKSRTGYSAYVPVLQGCVSTGSTIEETKQSIRVGIPFHLGGLQQDGIEIPVEFMGHYNLQFTFDVETFLQHYHKIFSRRALSRLTGINESLLSQYASGLKRPRPAQAKRIEKGLHQLANELLQINL